MALQVTQDWATSRYRFADPSVLMGCDNPRCRSSWLTGNGLVCWEVSRSGPEQSLFVDRLLFGCDRACLEQAQRACRWRHQRWSEPTRVADWMRRLAEGLAVDPESTEIGAFRSPNLAGRVEVFGQSDSE